MYWRCSRLQCTESARRHIDATKRPRVHLICLAVQVPYVFFLFAFLVSFFSIFSPLLLGSKHEKLAVQDLNSGNLQKLQGQKKNAWRSKAKWHSLPRETKRYETERIYCHSKRRNKNNCNKLKVKWRDRQRQSKWFEPKSRLDCCVALLHRMMRFCKFLILIQAALSIQLDPCPGFPKILLFRLIPTTWNWK